VDWGQALRRQRDKSIAASPGCLFNPKQREAGRTDKFLQQAAGKIKGAAPRKWRDWAQILQPATVKRRHTRALRRYWRWKSRGKPGRPAVLRKMQALLRRFSSENPLWGADRIRDTLRLLGSEPPHAAAVAGR